MRVKLGQVFLWHSVFFMLEDCFWILSSLHLEEVPRQKPYFQYFYFTITALFLFFLYTIMAYLIFFYFHKKKWYVLAGLLIISISIGVGVRHLIEEIAIPYWFGAGNYSDSTSFKYYFWDNFFNYGLSYSALGFVCFLFQYARYKDQQEQVLIIQNQKTELAYLRTQINPHFLFNTLNNIYSLVFQQSNKALVSIEKLTTMLRYGLYEQSEKIPIKTEIKQLHNFIALEQLRYDYDLQLEVDINNRSTQRVEVPPFLLIPFVENAFKHGDTKEKISIRLDINETELVYQVKNTIKEKQKDKIGGIGLKNIEKRLALIYEDKQNLEIKITSTVFEILLKIQL